MIKDDIKKTWIDRLEYSINNLCEIEIRLGKEIGSVIEGNIALNEIRMLIWGGLLEVAPQITPQDAGLLIEDFLISGKGQADDLFLIIVTKLAGAGLIVDKEDEELADEGKAESPSASESGE